MAAPGDGRRSRCRPECGIDHRLLDVVDVDEFAPAGGAGREAHPAPGNAEPCGDEIDQFPIRGVVDRRCGDADLDHAVVQPRKLGLGGARLDMNGETG